MMDEDTTRSGPWPATGPLIQRIAEHRLKVREMQLRQNGNTTEPGRVLWHMARLTAQGKETHKVTMISPDWFCWLLVDWLEAELAHCNIATEVSKWNTHDITAEDDDDDIPF